MITTHTLGRWALVAGLAMFAAVSTTAAQRGSGMGTPRYDPSTETTVSGTVADVQTQQGRARRTGVHLMLQTASGTTDVRVGPADWLTERAYTFQNGDALTVIGSLVTVDGAQALLAREITRGTTTMTLRNEKGIPLWAAARGRRQS